MVAVRPLSLMVTYQQLNSVMCAIPQMAGHQLSSSIVHRVIIRVITEEILVVPVVMAIPSVAIFPGLHPSTHLFAQPVIREILNLRVSTLAAKAELSSRIRIAVEVAVIESAQVDFKILE